MPKSLLGGIAPPLSALSAPPPTSQPSSQQVLAMRGLHGQRRPWAACWAPRAAFLLQTIPNLLTAVAALPTASRATRRPRGAHLRARCGSPGAGHGAAHAVVCAGAATERAATDVGVCACAARPQRRAGRGGITWAKIARARAVEAHVQRHFFQIWISRRQKPPRKGDVPEKVSAS